MAAQLNTEVSFFAGKRKGEYVIHLPLIGRAFKADEHAVEIVKKLQQGVKLLDIDITSQAFKKLNDLKLIGDGKFQVPRVDRITEFKPVEGTLIFTETCNLGCSYCYASASPIKSNAMPFEIAKVAVDTIFSNAVQEKEKFASFRYIGGGEPTIEWDLLMNVSEYIAIKSEELNVNYFIRLITNGTLLTPERVEWLAKNIQFVTLSFDILPELQAKRPDAKGKSTQGRLLQVCKILYEKGMNFHLRTTITTEGASRLTDMVLYTYQYTKANSIRFEPLSEIGRSVDSNLNKPMQEIFVEEFKKAYLLGEQLGIKVSCKMTQNFKRRSPRFCEAEFSVGPNGIVSACHRYSRKDHVGYELFQYGQIENSAFLYDIEKLNKVRMIDVHNFSDCQMCIAKWNCASGCLSARVNKEGISKSGPLCSLTRELLKFSIINELEEVV